MTQTRVASPPWGARLHTITRSYSVQQQPVMLRQSLLAHQSVLGQRSVSTTALNPLTRPHHMCDVSFASRTRHFRIFSSWGSQHRHKSQSQRWPLTCQPCRSLFLSSRKREEEEDRRDNLHAVSSKLKAIDAHACDAHWFQTCLQEGHGFLGEGWWQCDCTSTSPVREGNKGFCKRTAHCECW